MKKIFAIISLCAFLVQQSQAATFNVSDNTDVSSDANNLRGAIGASNTAGGSNTISWTTGGAITLGSVLPSIAANTTLDVSNAPSAVAISGSAMPLGGAVTFNNGSANQIWSISSTLSGSGSLVKIGAGNLYMNANNGYSGGTVMNAGTITVNSDAALGNGPLAFGGGTLQSQYSISDGRTVTLNAGGGTFDTLGSTDTFSGIIGGTGGLTKISSGTLILSGVNTYTGGTTVNGGVLAITNDNNLGGASGALTLNGGILQTPAAIASARALTLGAGGGTIDTDGLNSTLSGNINGSGGLTKIGVGILTLSGSNSYTGGTTINMGTLQLGANNALPSGALTVANGAIFDMGGFNQTSSLGSVTNNGTINMGASQLTMNTRYTGTGTLAMTLKQSLNNITGKNMDFSGTTLVLSLANPLLTNGQKFTPVSGGSITGQFAKIVAPAAFQFIPDYTNPNSLVLTTQFVPFANIAANRNQGAVGSALEPLRVDAPTGDAAAVLSQLYVMDAAHLQSALDQIGPVALGCMGSMGMTGSSVQSAAVNQRMNLLAQGAVRDHFSRYTVSRPSPYPGTMVASADEGPEVYDSGASDLPEGGNTPWGVFASGVGTVGRLREANSDAGLQPGYAFDTGGITGGADYRINDHLAAGLSTGYLHGHASLYAPAVGTVDNNSVRYGLYATGFMDNFRANLYAGKANDSFSTNRGIVFGDLARTASAQPQGKETNLYASTVYDIRTQNWGIFSPFAALNYDRLVIDPFTESGAGILDLAVNEQTARSLRSSLGLRYGQKAKLGSTMITTYISLGWRHEFDDQSRPIEAQLASGAGSVFSVATGSFARDGTLLGGGISFDLSRQLSAKVDYSGDFRSHFMDNAFNLSARYRF